MCKLRCRFWTSSLSAFQCIHIFLLAKPKFEAKKKFANSVAKRLNFKDEKEKSYFAERAKKSRTKENDDFKLEAIT